MKDCITWNDIHMKTSVASINIKHHLIRIILQPSGGEHGYPDPNYLKNLMEDLKVRGITEASILEHLRNHPDLRTRGRM